MVWARGPETPSTPTHSVQESCKAQATNLGVFCLLQRCFTFATRNALLWKLSGVFCADGKAIEPPRGCCNNNIINQTFLPLELLARCCCVAAVAVSSNTAFSGCQRKMGGNYLINSDVAFTALVVVFEKRPVYRFAKSQNIFHIATALRAKKDLLLCFLPVLLPRQFITPATEVDFSGHCYNYCLKSLALWPKR